MPYIGKSPHFGVRNRFVYVASSGATSVSGADANGATLTFTDGAFVDVYLNGVLLKTGTDYNTNTANTIAGLSALSANDEVTVVVYDIFAVADTVSATSGGTFSGNVTFNGDISVGDDISLASDGAVLGFGADNEITVTHVADTGLRMEDTDKFQLGAGGDLSLSHNGTNSLIANSTGALLISGDDIAMNSSGGESMFSALSNGTVRLYHDNVVKITTAANGMVLGGASADQQIHFDGASDWSLGIDNSDSGFLKISNSDTVGTTDAMVFAASRRIRIGGSTSDAGRLNMNFTHSTGMVGIDMIPDATTATMLQFKNSGGSVAGSITTGGSSTAFNTSSDYRLKENVNYSWDATSRLKQLKPARFNFKADADTTVDGFLAHEVSSIIPEAIFGTKDETRDIGLIKDKDGVVLEDNALEVQTKKDEGQTWTKTKTEDVYQGIDQSKLVPLLVKALQELEARVTALESK